MRAHYGVPLFFFVCIGFILFHGLNLHPENIPSPLINKAAPTFSLPQLEAENKTASDKDFSGHVTLFNVWATWCPTCLEEHEFLLTLAHDPSFVLYGLDYKDDSTAAKKWLAERGNPYQTVAMDTSGKVAINWGVYGTPETYVIDKNGIIRYKYIGALTATVWYEKIKPIVDKLKNDIG
jgi:cytochrome c biogenesis protein CcmG/thiol:disulfide interchange protein DsbE